METPRKQVVADTLPELGIVLVGLLLAIFGLFVQDSLGVNLIVTALGVALLVSGISYIATEGSDWVRFTNAFVSLVAAQLLAFSGVIQWTGGIIVVLVVVSVIYSRL